MVYFPFYVFEVLCLSGCWIYLLLSYLLHLTLSPDSSSSTHSLMTRTSDCVISDSGKMKQSPCQLAHFPLFTSSFTKGFSSTPVLDLILTSLPARKEEQNFEFCFECFSSSSSTPPPPPVLPLFLARRTTLVSVTRVHSEPGGLIQVTI